MKSRPNAASYQCGLRLMAAGCPIDYLDALPRDIGAYRKDLYLRELGGYAESCVFDYGNYNIGYVIVLVIGTDLPRGAVISDWHVSPPWDHPVDWDHDPRDVIPRSDHSAYAELFDSRLRGVLNERRLLTRGHPVAGVLCGVAYLESLPQIPESVVVADATIHVTDDMGRKFRKDFRLTIDRRLALKRARAEQRHPLGLGTQRVLEKRLVRRTIRLASER